MRQWPFLHFEAMTGLSISNLKLALTGLPVTTQAGGVRIPSVSCQWLLVLIGEKSHLSL